MAKRYTVQLMAWPYEQWAVWDRVQRREVSWLHHDRKVVAKMVREMNAVGYGDHETPFCSMRREEVA